MFYKFNCVIFNQYHNDSYVVLVYMYTRHLSRFATTKKEKKNEIQKRTRVIFHVNVRVSEWVSGWGVFVWTVKYHEKCDFLGVSGVKYLWKMFAKGWERDKKWWLRKSSKKSFNKRLMVNFERVYLGVI